MARVTKFNKEEVLEAALGVFWDKGYNATSMLDLEKVTGLKPGSIYNSFGSKKGLFLEVLSYYQRTVIETRIQQYLLKNDPIEAIEDFFRSTYMDALPEQLIGCLLTNTATELSDKDQDINQHIVKSISVLENAFYKRLLEAKSKQLIHPSADIRALSVHLNASFQGLCVIGRLTKDTNRLKLIVDHALASIHTNRQGDNGSST